MMSMVFLEIPTRAERRWMVSLDAIECVYEDYVGAIVRLRSGFEIESSGTYDDVRGRLVKAMQLATGQEIEEES